MHTSELQRRVRELVETTVQHQGFDLVAVEWLSGRGRPVLRLSVEGPTGIGADDCARLSHFVGPALDADDPFSGPYTLEVSSPGIDRPVQRLADFRRFIGYRARIRMEEGLPRRRYTGTIVSVDEDDVHVDVDGTTFPLSFDSIDSAHLVLDLDQFQQLAEGPPPIPTPSDEEEGTASSRRTSP